MTWSVGPLKVQKKVMSWSVGPLKVTKIYKDNKIMKNNIISVLT